MKVVAKVAPLPTLIVPDTPETEVLVEQFCTTLSLGALPRSRLLAYLLVPLPAPSAMAPEAWLNPLLIRILLLIVLFPTATPVAPHPAVLFATKIPHQPAWKTRLLETTSLHT